MSHFLVGLQHFQVFKDHNPLIPILNNHRLDEIENPHLQRLRTRIMGYNFTVKWFKGCNNSAPDALSRNLMSDPSPHDVLSKPDIFNQLEISILRSEPLLPQVTLAPIWRHYVRQLRKMQSINDYGSSSLMASLSIAYSYPSVVNNTGISMITSPLMIASS